MAIYLLKLHTDREEVYRRYSTVLISYLVLVEAM